MPLPFPSYAYALRGWGIGIWLVITFVSLNQFLLFYWNQFLLFYWNQFLLFEVVVSFVSLNQFFFTVAAIFISYKNQKKTACGLYYKYEVSMKKSLLYPTYRGKKILPIAEKLLRHPTFRGKIWNEPYFQKTKMSFQYTKMSIRLFEEIKNFSSCKVKHNYIKAWQ